MITTTSMHDCMKSKTCRPASYLEVFMKINNKISICKI